jgi:hypothetical protein
MRGSGEQPVAQSDGSMPVRLADVVHNRASGTTHIRVRHAARCGRLIALPCGCHSSAMQNLLSDTDQVPRRYEHTKKIKGGVLRYNENGAPEAGHRRKNQKKVCTLADVARMENDGLGWWGVTREYRQVIR